ncbi:gluconate 2-dehydrogenase subunit 3 family protein [Novosphingobium sp. AAP83]|uniref:gluconate 2-dehydrogenase subunit 3 family protein n=1 Tax=Novosphingobium sp. AAP83 TaxID=1523425 RepID=UPI0006B9EEF7|nr:gluconate 2-dehydrogenase subunit 3 family protein [Novosphingobium sp. AAP83]
MKNPMLIDRRTLIERALMLVGAGAAAGTFSASALASAAARTKPYLDSATFALLTAVADTIVPRTDTAGAIDAKVPATIDALLVNWASGERRYQLSQALVEIDGLAHTAHGKGFAQLSATERLALLKSHDEAALKVGAVQAPRSIKNIMAGPAFANPGYGKLKELIVLLYYISEPALTQELSYIHAPGEWQPSIPVTSETRPAAGGMF